MMQKISSSDNCTALAGLNHVLVDTIPFGLDIVDARGHILFLNRRFKKKFGRAASNKKCWEVYRDNKKQCDNCPLKKGIRLGETSTIDVENCLGGRIIRIFHTGMIYRNKKAILEIFEDITDQEKTAKELASVSRFPSENPYPIFRVGKDGTVLYANKACKQLPRKRLKCSPGEKVAPELYSLVRSSLSSNEPRFFELLGNSRNFLFSIVPVKEAGYTNLYSMDITEREKLAKALEKERYHLAKAQEIAHVGTWDLDAKSDKLIWTDEVYRIFGVPLGTSLTYKKFLDSVHPDDREYVNNKWKAALKKEPYDVSHRIIVGGKIKWVREKAELKFDSKGNVIRGVGAVQDITAQKEAAEIKAKFASIASHELRNPVCSIKDGVSVVLDGLAGELNENQKKFLGMVKDSADTLVNLANNLLDFQKLTTGGIPLKFEKNDINKLLEETCETTCALAKQKGLSCVRNLDGTLPKINFDRDRIREVLVNLIANAIKFTEKGGINISTSQKNNTVRVAVKDTGFGIRKEDLPKLFQTFVQLYTPKKVPEKGTGLGLAICKEIVEGHKGKIWAKSEFGKGTIFYFTLPITS